MIADLLQTKDVKKTLSITAQIIVPTLLFFSLMLFVVAPAFAHVGPDYCGHTQRYITSDGKIHQQQFVREASGPDHIFRSRHVAWTGTGYTPLSDWNQSRANNCH